MTRIVQGWSGISFSFSHGLSMWLAWAFAQLDGLPTSYMLTPEHKGGQYQTFLLLVPKSSRMPLPFNSVGHSSHRVAQIQKEMK